MSKIVAVIGFGTMGSGIAQTFVEAGYQVIALEKVETLFTRGLKQIQRNWERSIEKGRLTTEKKTQLEQLLTVTTDWNRIANSEFIVEAISENIDLKKEVFKEISQVVSENAIIASNTSGLSITEVASVVLNPSRVIGCHFFNPVPVMKLVELIRGYDTSEQTYVKTKEIVLSLGKESIEVNESPLFAVNRILVPMINEAIFVLQEGVASAEDIDRGMKLGANHPIGPLALADLIGLDTLLFVQDSLYENTQDSKYRSAPLLRKLVRAGHLGRKTGKGFFEYK
ncbi:3-hydroxyacyl-CoA dehydrogenase NAD-binding domain-containing protein [Schinkia azotoformans]|uniref:3-hydroxyacyl-CoA dehydrogenase NAD-binding domain-containing protein n=1 Tax=Schinkia azotoformans TaxID=1454 RepID=UPI002DB95441|nr:3-hydroxyacyl-CoA dehydrogenase NAD-binding domain-containing protein [Schinkia azotoformans]MEC1716978.1 3-hydroxyacyl-CoA dehydrogenase NAD-binding domain-containing protein [Schinkia azotoformans]MEC1743261.1 3-hydroxyacyl-CoA dehydrogenase NAD-binding domain-containing protein [Schinkia azotoformans]MEC1744838.1 3-hydroxyacyl-CoA dehydrogenase NAD-binding domain-containing protein [Schinkia azotoformans]MEC1757018.1 3-hydroxyacyl-CoA dehydrogenase NAD-binding domain-containing protein [S